MMRASLSLRFRVFFFISAIFLSFAPLSLNAQSDPMFRSWNRPIEPFRIIGNIYYVGAENVSSFLIATSDGLIVLDGGFPETAPIIKDNIKKLGFTLENVKILLCVHAHVDHAGGLVELKKWTRAILFSSEADAVLLANGGKGDPQFGDQYPFPSVKADGIVRDKEQVKLGESLLTAYLTPGHTKGCLTWTMKAKEGDKTYDVVFMSSISCPGYKFRDNPKYPDNAADFEYTFKFLKTLPCDVYLAQHGFEFSFKEKRERLEKGEKTNPFIDPQGYRDAIDRAEKKFREQLEKERKEE
ncbi:MAG: subclass B3 metallo-beta-lactamase [Candidatus Omnitrophota bacterium]